VYQADRYVIALTNNLYQLNFNIIFVPCSGRTLPSSSPPSSTRNRPPPGARKQNARRAEHQASATPIPSPGARKQNVQRSERQVSASPSRQAGGRLRDQVAEEQADQVEEQVEVDSSVVPSSAEKENESNQVRIKKLLGKLF
jgi:hypothetical protein